VTGHVIGVSPFTAAGSDDMKNTPTFSLAMPVDGTAGQLAAVAVPSGTRPYVLGSYVAAPRLIVTTLSSGQLFARNTAKHGGLISG
jgi:hypothetical protein